MSNKHKKKRTKAYQGTDARTREPVITRVTAANRHPAHQWLYDRRQFARPLTIGAAVLFVLTLIISQIVRMIHGA